MGAPEKETKRAGRKRRRCRTQQKKVPMKIEDREWLARGEWSEGESEDVMKRAGRDIKSEGWSEV